MESLVSMDVGILNWIAEHFHSELLNIVMPFISVLGNNGMIFILFSAILIALPKERAKGIQILLAMLFSLLLCNLILKNWAVRVRPFDVVNGIVLLVPAPHDYSFPSGHTSAAFAAATVLFRNRSRIKYLFLGFALLMGFSRLYLYVHFPSDVAGGILTGIASGYLATQCYRMLAKAREQQKRRR